MNGSSARLLLRSWHRLQSRSDTCVAGCRAIVDAWLGGEGVEVTCLPALRDFVDVSEPRAFDLLAARIGRDAVAIVLVFPGPWMDLARLASRKSQYGDLDRTTHAVVVVAFDPATKIFVVLDPYFPASAQPTHVSRDDFAGSWTGAVEFHSRSHEE